VAAVKLGGDAVVMSVLDFMKNSTAPEEIKFAAQTISRVKGDTVLRAMAKTLPTMNAQARSPSSKPLRPAKPK